MMCISHQYSHFAELIRRWSRKEKHSRHYSVRDESHFLLRPLHRNTFLAHSKVDSDPTKSFNRRFINRHGISFSPYVSVNLSSRAQLTNHTSMSILPPFPAPEYLLPSATPSIIGSHRSADHRVDGSSLLEPIDDVAMSIF